MLELLRICAYITVSKQVEVPKTMNQYRVFVDKQDYPYLDERVIVEAKTPVEAIQKALANDCEYRHLNDANIIKEVALAAEGADGDNMIDGYVMDIASGNTKRFTFPGERWPDPFGEDRNS